MLSLTLKNIRDSGLYVKPSKTKNSIGETREYIFTSDLYAVIKRNIALLRTALYIHLFCNENGQPYMDEKLKSPDFTYKWGLLMKKALKETKLLERFQERDIRTKTATDADDSGQDATKLLGHGDIRTTRIYLRSKQVKKNMPLQIPSSNDNRNNIS